MYELDTLPAPSRLDLEQQLGAVSVALSDAIRRRNGIERQIRATDSIEALAGLHDQWRTTVEEQQQAHDRQRELQQILAAN